MARHGYRPGIDANGDSPRDPVETWPREQLEAYQLEAVRRQLARLASAPGFASRLDDVRPEDLRSLEDIRQLPVTTKQDFRDALARRPPLGDQLGVAPEQVARIHFSSGTTAQPTPCAWSAADLDRWAELYARSAASQGVGASDVHQCLFSYAWFVGGLGATEAYSRLGATVIPGGSADTERQIDTIFRYGTTSVGGTPSFLLHIADTAERLGIDLRESQVRHVMVGGEPGGALPATRQAIEERWGARCYDGYGCLEFQPIAWECAAQAGGHLCEDFAYAEVLEPDTLAPVPDGTPGVLVLTHLDKQAHPLIRWWTGDIVVRDRSACPCGRTHARLPGGVRGRADDMLVIRGVNVFPSAVEDIVRRHPAAGGEYRIVLTPELRDPASGYLTGFRLEVERRTDGAPADLADQIGRQIHAELKVRPVVEIVEPGALHSEGQKARRVVHLA